MKIRDFFSTLNFSISILNDRNNEDVRNFEDNFDDIMRSSIEYIRNLAEDNRDSLSDDYDINDLVLDDYDYISEETFKNTDIYPISMKYIASKYLNSHRYLIPELEKEIEERGLVFREDESYTDDFHENLVTALLAVKHDYIENYGTLLEDIPEEIASVLRVGEEQNEKETAFKRLYSQYGNASMVPYNVRRNVMTMGYYSLFGIQGLDSKSGTPNSLKIKNSFHIKDYIQSYVERLEPVYKSEIVNSIFASVYQLDRFGEIYEKIEAHNDRMRRYGLPGLGYQSDEKEIYPKLPRFEQLMTEENLMKQNIDDLLTLNAFYNNRFAKVMNEYALALFVIGNLNTTQRCVDGEEITKSKITQGKLNMLVTKYQTLILPIKQYYAEEQSRIQDNPYDFIESTAKFESNSEDNVNFKKSVELNSGSFIKRVSKIWRNNYKDYYNQRLPDVENNLEDDLAFVNVLYNPIFLSYRFKQDSIKSAYAYLDFLSKEEPNKSLNYGIVLENYKDGRKNNILLAFDGLLDSTVRLHTNKEEFRDFLVAQTGSSDIRMFVGFEDFYFGGEYISSQLVAPQSKEHEKFLKGVKNGSISKEFPSVRVTPINEKFLEHVEYNMNKSKFMSSHKIVMAKKNKKGKLVQEEVQPVMKFNMDTSKKYIQKDDGEFVEERKFNLENDVREDLEV